MAFTYLKIIWCQRVKCLHYRGVCLWSGGCLHLVSWGVYHTPPVQTRADTPQADTPPGQAPQWVDTPLARHPLADPLKAGTPPGRHPRQTTPHSRVLWDTVNKWAVRIPLECVLVIDFIHFVKVSFISDIPYLGPMPNLFLGGRNLDTLLMTSLLDFKISIYFKYNDSEQAPLIDCTLTHFQLG